MNNILKTYLNEISETLGKLGYELCQQANSPEPLNIHGNVAEAVRSLSYNLHNLASDLDKLRFDFIKNGECQELNPIEIETVYGAMQHLLHSSPYTLNGERTSLAGELHKLDYIISSLYRLKIHGGKGSDEYLFDKITEQEL